MSWNAQQASDEFRRILRRARIPPSRYSADLCGTTIFYPWKTSLAGATVFAPDLDRNPLLCVVAQGGQWRWVSAGRYLPRVDAYLYPSHRWLYNWFNSITREDLKRFQSDLAEQEALAALEV